MYHSNHICVLDRDRDRPYFFYYSWLLSPWRTSHLTLYAVRLLISGVLSSYEISGVHSRPSYMAFIPDTLLIPDFLCRDNGSNDSILLCYFQLFTLSLLCLPSAIDSSIQFQSPSGDTPFHSHSFCTFVSTQSPPPPLYTTSSSFIRLVLVSKVPIIPYSDMVS